MNLKLAPKFQLVLEILFLICIFSLSIVPLRDYDIWFHIKSGEIFSQMGIIRHDVFSYSASGREWVPYEWLFQIGVYFFQQLFGFEAIKYLIAGIVTIQSAILLNLFKKILNLNFFASIFLVFLFFVSVYEFFTARPHVLAYTFFIFNLLIVLYYFLKSKNYLWTTIPVTLAWANMHGSIFLSIYLFGAYAALSFINYFHKKDKEWFKKFKTLGIFTLLTAVLTILPPLDILQYKLLWTFYKNKDFISKYIDEWTPLSFNELGFTIYSVTAVLLVIILALLVILRKRYKATYWILPLIPLLITPYLAIRNLYLGYISIAVMGGIIISEMSLLNLKKIPKYLLLSLAIILVVAHIWLMGIKRDSASGRRAYFPINAVEFIKKYDLKGNMFNEYGYGGYLLYQLYPKYKVLFDGRSDIYLCCEMPDTLELATKKNLPDDEYNKFLYTLWDKYNISYVIVKTEKHTVLRKITKILTDDPNWNLVFWDDHTQIFVRRDGKNDSIIKEFETKAATPYSRNPYRDGMEDQALSEYERMLKVVDSAKSRNTIGFIKLKKGDVASAQEEFEKAIALDPTNESAFMNLAEIVASNHDYTTAINLYKQAQTKAPDRGLIYVRLGQLFIEGFGDTNSAKQIWEKGLKETVDDDAKKTLQNLLNTN